MKPTNVARGAVFLLAGFIGLGSSVGLLGAEEGSKAALDRISARTEGKSSVIRLDGSGLGEAKAFFADAQRFVIDVPGAQGVVKPPRIEGKSQVSKIRIGRHSGEKSKVRIVLDLRGPSAVEEVARTGSSIELRVTREAKSRYAALGSAPAQDTAVVEGTKEARASEPASPSGDEKAAKAKVDQVEGKTSGEGAQAAVVAAETQSSSPSASEPPSAGTAAEKASVVPKPAAGSTGSEQISVAKADQGERSASAKTVEAKAKAGSGEGLGFKGEMAAGLAPQSAVEALAGGTSSTAGSAPASTPEAGPMFDKTIGKAGPEYTGKRISLDFQDADIKNVLRLIAEVSGFNLITSEDVTGKVTVKLLNVPWDHALDIILKTKGLGQVREGTIIRVAPVASLTKEQEDAAKRREAEARAEPTVTRIVTMNFARAKDAMPTLKKALSSKGDITVDERTNTLVIQDIAKNAEQVAELAKTLDKSTPQVLIEARIVEVSTNYLKELGIQWGGHYVRDPAHGNALPYRFPNTLGVGAGASAPGTYTSAKYPTSPLTGGGAEAAGTGTGGIAGREGNIFAVNLPAAVGMGSGGSIGFTVGSIANIMGLDIILSALENSGKLKILSNPKVATLDNKEATIKSGRKIPYATVSAAGTSVQFIDAVLELKVTPHITDDRHVDMKVVATKNEADFGFQVLGTPSIVVKEANTQLLVRDGDTIVLGGVFKTTESDSKAGLPWLSDIPVLGWLFKKETTKKDNEELLIFITPRVIKPASV